MRSLTTLALLLSTVTALSAQQKVWVVDKNGGPGTVLGIPHPSQLQDGDTILLRGGSHAVLLADKAVTILSDSRSTRATLNMAITDLSANKTITLRGMTLTGVLLRCKGSVVLDDCELNTNQFGLPAKFEDCAQVTMTNSSCMALELKGTHLQLHGSRITGVAFSGSHGISVDGTSSLVAADSQIKGADGRGAYLAGSQCLTPAIPGGDGVHVAAKGRAELHNCTLLGGRAAPAVTPCPGAPAGQPFRNNGGTVIQNSRAPHRLEAPSPVRVGELLTVGITGNPGDQALLLVNFDHGVLPIPGCGAALFPSPFNLGILPLGPLGNNPTRVEVVVQPLAGTRLANTLAVQALLLPKNGCVLSPPTTITLLHPSL